MGMEENIEPIKTDEEPGPEEMIAYVRCKCDPTWQKHCNCRSCSCFRYGLKCVDALSKLKSLMIMKLNETFSTYLKQFNYVFCELVT